MSVARTVSRWLDVTPMVRIATALVIGVAVALLLPWSSHASAVLGGWAAAGVVFVLWTLLVIVPMDAAATRSHSQREDPSRAASNAIVLLAAIASLGAVVDVLHHSGMRDNLASMTAILGAVVLSWGVVHTLFALNYARLYYADPVGGMNFHQDEPPCYTDFTYLAVTVGMSFAVSDTDLTSSSLRRHGQVHALLSYLFGTVIVALLVNLVAGLAQ